MALFWTSHPAFLVSALAFWNIGGKSIEVFGAARARFRESPLRALHKSGSLYFVQETAAGKRAPEQGSDGRKLATGEPRFLSVGVLLCGVPALVVPQKSNRR
jgi:hypothetical protein